MESKDCEFTLKGYDWAKRTQIGVGSFSKVYRVKRSHSAEEVAVKQIDMRFFEDASQLKALHMEIDLMNNLKSENVVAMYESALGKQFSYIVMELCDSDLRQRLASNEGKFPQQEAVRIYTQILKGFKFLVGLGYIHRDVKPQNILTKGQCCKITDFGFSCKADMNYIHKLEELCGTPLYMAPQILYEKAYTAKCDIWSLGVMLYEMVYGYGPWVCRNMDSYRSSIVNKPLSFPYNGKIGANTKDFIKRCLVINEEKRIGWKELFEHPLVCDSDPGQPISNIKVTKSAVEVMKRIQESAARKNIDILKPFESGVVAKLNLKQFEKLCGSIDPTVSAFEVRILFEAIDTSKDGNVDYGEFRSMMLDIDFRDVNDVANRCIRQLIEIIKCAKLDIKQLFEEFDRNRSGAIDFEEFTRLVHQFLPKMAPADIRPLYRKFDKDGSGDISLKEFMCELTKGVTSTSNTEQLLNEKAQRCLTALKAAVSYYTIDLKQLMEGADINHDSLLDFKEFCSMVACIDKQLPPAEQRLIFDYLDEGKKGTVSLSYLKKMLS